MVKINRETHTLIKKLEYQEISDSPTVKHYTKWKLYDPYIKNLRASAGTGLEIETISGSLEVTSTPDNPILGRLIKPLESKIIAAHYAALGEALIIKMSGNVKLNIFATEDLGDSTIHARHLMLITKPNTKAEIVINAQNFKEDALETFFIELHAHDNSKINLLFYVEPPNKTPSISIFKRVLGKETELNYAFLSSGGLMHHQREESYLLERSKLFSGSSFISGIDEKLDYYASVVHEGFYGNSIIRSQGIALERGYAVARGLAKISKKGEWSSTLFEAGVTILGDNAKGYAAPMLEIDTGNVREARHEATEAKINEDHIFYLQTRGLSREESERILIYGLMAYQLNFLEEPLYKMAEKLLIGLINKKIL